MIEIQNKKAYFNYFIEEEYEAGIVLSGTEIKSIRKGSVDIKDSYIRIKNNEAFIINMYIAKYEVGEFYHDEYQERKLLLHKNEIKKLKDKVAIDGLTLIPIKVYIKKGYAKVLVGVCKGKKIYDKRASIKEKDSRKVDRQNYI